MAVLGVVQTCVKQLTVIPVTDVSGEMEIVVEAVKNCALCHKAATAAVEMIGVRIWSLTRVHRAPLTIHSTSVDGYPGRYRNYPTTRHDISCCATV
jgi:hypothetical protein